MTKHAPTNATDLFDRLLALMGHELMDLAATVGRLQGTLGPLLIDAAGADPALIPAIQQFDLVEQLLVNLGRVIVRLRSPHDADTVRDALETISLADLKRRLNAACVALHPVADHLIANDEIELF